MLAFTKFVILAIMLIFAFKVSIKY